MPTLEEVQAQISALGNVDTFGTRKEIRYLPDILAQDETIRSLTSGIMDGNTWLIVCTDRRVIFLDKGLIYGLKQKEIPLGQINSVEADTGIVFGTIGISDGASKMEIKNVFKDSVRTFSEAVNQACEDLRSGQRRSPADHRDLLYPTADELDDPRQRPRPADYTGRDLLLDQLNNMEDLRQQQLPADITGGDVITQLERLAALRDRGILSEKEFQAQKARLLGNRG